MAKDFNARLQPLCPGSCNDLSSHPTPGVKTLSVNVKLSNITSPDHCLGATSQQQRNVDLGCELAKLKQTCLFLAYLTLPTLSYRPRALSVGWFE